MSDEQQIAAKSHFDKVALSLSQCMDCNSNGLEDECSICLDIPKANDVAITPCSHLFCRQCLLDALDKQNGGKTDTVVCPFCTVDIKASNIKFTKSIPPIKKKNPKLPVTKKKHEVNAREILKSALRGNLSSKISAILKELDKVWRLDQGSKVVIFSQYLGMLDLIGRTLDEKIINFYRLDGKLSLKERRYTLKQFSAYKSQDLEHNVDSKQGSVLLASMKACGVGLNLVSASTVFIVDPWWNAAMEDQCINRIHRIGQVAKVVRIRKFIVKDSVEEKIVRMQQRKKGVASKVLNHQNDVGEKSSNPTLEDFKAIFGR